MTTEQLSKLPKEDLAAEVSNIIYEKTRVFEDLENAGVLSGNLHHLRQKFAELAEEEILARFIDKGKVISKPNAAIKVTQFSISQKTQEKIDNVFKNKI